MQYNTPQDKLLIMLLERISALEDEQQKLRKVIEKSIANILPTDGEPSMYIGICMETKRTSSSCPFNDVLMLIKATIQEVFPECTLYIERSVTTYWSSLSIVLYLSFKTPVSLNAVKEALNIKLYRYVNIHSWNRIPESYINTLSQGYLVQV